MIARPRIPQLKGTRGSLKWIQRLVSTRATLLTDAIRADTQQGAAWTIDWRSPLEPDDWAEYRDSGFLVRTDRGDLADALAEFWPTGGPQWDALGRASDGGVVLVEAKAHAPELASSCTAGEGSTRRILASLDAAKPTYGAPSSADWLRGYYQYANRLAHLRFLRGLGNPAVLALVYFYGDDDMKGPMSIEVWKRELDVVYRHLGVSGDLASHGVCNVFIDVAAL